MSQVQEAAQADGYRGIWSFSVRLRPEATYKYAGGLATCSAMHRPMAVYRSEVGKTFFVYGGATRDGRGHASMVSFYDHGRGTVPRPRMLAVKDTTDAHDNPSLSIAPDGRVWVFCSAHGTMRPSYVYKSTRPYSIDEFELVREVNFSYPQPWQVGEQGLLFLHTFYHFGRRLRWATCDPDGVWAAPHELALAGQGHYQVSSPHGRAVGTAFDYHPAATGNNGRTNLYYLQTGDLGRTWQNAAGEGVDVPVRCAENAAIVRRYEAEGLLVYLKDLNYDAEGRPVVLFVTTRGYKPGPANGPRTWTTAHWTGRGWAIGGTILSEHNYDCGCLHVEPDGEWRLIAPTARGPQAYAAGGEVTVWVSRDRGASWSVERTVTAGSRYNHNFCRRPLNAHPDFYALWADGNGWEPSESRLYFCDRAGSRARRLPTLMSSDFAEPDLVE